MVIIWGSKLYGKTDVVPGLFHVATKFGHLWYIPLIPTSSFLVLSEDGDGWRGLDIPMSGKSVLLAWLRTAAFIGTIVACVASIPMIMDPLAPMGTKVGGVAVILGAIAAIYFTMFHSLTKNAGYTRALELASYLGPEAEALVDRYFDQISDAELESRLSAGEHDGDLGEYGQGHEFE